MSYLFVYLIYFDVKLAGSLAASLGFLKFSIRIFFNFIYLFVYLLLLFCKFECCVFQGKTSFSALVGSLRDISGSIKVKYEFLRVF
jgi:hypothetical protein